MALTPPKPKYGWSGQSQSDPMEIRIGDRVYHGMEPSKFGTVIYGPTQLLLPQLYVWGIEWDAFPNQTMDHDCDTIHKAGS